MSRELAKWMRTANIAVTNEIVTAREKGIENFLNSKMEENDIIEIVKLYFTGKCNDDFLETVVVSFYEYDNTFSDDKIVEIRVLAGAIIYEMIEQGNYEDIIEMIEMYAQMYEFLGYDSIVGDISKKIYKDLRNRMLDLRENISFDAKKIGVLGKGINFNVSEEEEIVYDNSVVQKLTNVVKKVNELTIQMNNFSKTVSEHESIIHEDTQILWWLLTGYSDDADIRYSDINPYKAAILVGKDLAKRVNVFPGPSSAKAVLTKVLEFADEETGSLETYIDSLEDNIIESLLGDCDIVSRTPILMALKKKMENGEGHWMNSFLKEYQIKKEKFSVVEIAYEMYIECLAFWVDDK